MHTLRVSEEYALEYIRIRCMTWSTWTDAVSNSILVRNLNFDIDLIDVFFGIFSTSCIHNTWTTTLGKTVAYHTVFGYYSISL